MTITIEKLNHGFRITDSAGHTEKYWWMSKYEALMQFKTTYGHRNKRFIDIIEKKRVSHS